MKTVLIIIKLGLLSAFLCLFALLAANILVEKTATDKLYNSTNKIPYNKVGVLLGTNKTLKNGRINLYYKYRIDGAAKLFHSGKIDYILVSGDNSSKGYDEPTTIKKDLIKKGVPSKKIFLDYAGFRTLDSVVRSKEIFGQTSITLISQQFHNERAIYISEYKGIRAIGFNAKDVNIKYGIKTRLRERLARVKMFIDLVFGKQPKFMGEKIEIQQ